MCCLHVVCLLNLFRSFVVCVMFVCCFLFVVVGRWLLLFVVCLFILVCMLVVVCVFLCRRLFFCRASVTLFVVCSLLFAFWLFDVVCCLLCVGPLLLLCARCSDLS